MEMGTSGSTNTTSKRETYTIAHKWQGRHKGKGVNDQCICRCHSTQRGALQQLQHHFHITVPITLSVVTVSSLISPGNNIFNSQAKARNRSYRPSVIGSERALVLLLWTLPVFSLVSDSDLFANKYKEFWLGERDLVKSWDRGQGGRSHSSKEDRSRAAASPMAIKAMLTSKRD